MKLKLTTNKYANQTIIAVGCIFIGMIIFAFAGAMESREEKRISYQLEQNQIGIDERTSQAITSDKWNIKETKKQELYKQINILTKEQLELEKLNSESRKRENRAKCLWEFAEKYNVYDFDENKACPNNKETKKEIVEVSKSEETTYLLAEAVSKAEGGGVNPTNPCNIRDFHTGGFKVYNNRDEGLKACHDVLDRYVQKRPDITLSQAISIFSPASDNNNPIQHTDNILYYVNKWKEIGANRNSSVAELLKI